MAFLSLVQSIGTLDGSPLQNRVVLTFVLDRFAPDRPSGANRFLSWTRDACTVTGAPWSTTNISNVVSAYSPNEIRIVADGSVAFGAYSITVSATVTALWAGSDDDTVLGTVTETVTQTITGNIEHPKIVTATGSSTLFMLDKDYDSTATLAFSTTQNAVPIVETYTITTTNSVAGFAITTTGTTATLGVSNFDDIVVNDLSYTALEEIRTFTISVVGNTSGESRTYSFNIQIKKSSRSNVTVKKIRDVMFNAIPGIIQNNITNDNGAYNNNTIGLCITADELFGNVKFKNITAPTTIYPANTYSGFNHNNLVAVDVNNIQIFTSIPVSITYVVTSNSTVGQVGSKLYCSSTVTTVIIGTETWYKHVISSAMYTTAARTTYPNLESIELESSLNGCDLMFKDKDKLASADTYENMASGNTDYAPDGSDLGFLDGESVPTTPVSSVSLSPTTTIVPVGGTQQLTETVSPVDATDKTVTWSTSDAAVATVSASGLVTAVSAGNATITVTTTSGARTATCDVTATLAEVDSGLTGFQVKGTDLNAIFAGRNGLPPRPDIVYTAGGVNLSSLFAQLSDGTAAPVTGYKVGGVDLNTLFAAKGSLTLFPPVPVVVVTPPLSTLPTQVSYSPSGSSKATVWNVSGKVYSLNWWQGVNRYVATDQKSNFIYHSLDGITWDISVGPTNSTTASLNFGEQGTKGEVAKVKNLFYTTTADSITSHPTLWTPIQGQSDITSGVGSYANISSDAYLVCRQGANGVIQKNQIGKRTASGYDFTTVTSTSNLLKYMNPSGIANNGNTYVIVSSFNSSFTGSLGLSGNNDGIIYSTDGGINFSRISSLTGLPNGRSWNDVFYSGGYFVAVAADKIAYSSDAITWTEVNYPGTPGNFVFGTGAYNRIFISTASLTEKTVYHTTDFITWDSFQPALDYVLGLAYQNNKLFVYGSKSGTIGICQADY